MKKVIIGRPTKYLPDIIYPKIEEYISSCGREQTSLPTVEGLALHLNVNPDTLFEWAKKYPEFSESIKKILSLQKKQLIDDGMYGGKDVNAAMAIFLLKVNQQLYNFCLTIELLNYHLRLDQLFHLVKVI